MPFLMSSLNKCIDNINRISSVYIINSPGDKNTFLKSISALIILIYDRLDGTNNEIICQLPSQWRRGYHSKRPLQLK